MENLTKIESGGQKGEALMHIPLQVNTDPNRKRPTLHLQHESTHCFTSASRRSEDFLLAWQQLSQ